MSLKAFPKLSPFKRSLALALCTLCLTATLLVTLDHPFDVLQNFQASHEKYSSVVVKRSPVKTPVLLDEDVTISLGKSLHIDSKFAELDRFHLKLHEVDGTADQSTASASNVTSSPDSYDLSNSDSNNTHQYAFHRAAVACDVPICSKLGADVMKKGGSAVDAAVTVSLCLGSVNSFSSGIGGGGFMVARIPYKTSSATNHSDPEAAPHHKDALAFNFREKAPGASTKTMFNGNSSLSKVGGLAVGIPGELAGLYEAFKRYSSGKLTWAELIEPVAELNEKGFEISLPFSQALASAGPAMLQHPDGWEWLLTTEPPTNTSSSPSATSSGPAGLASDSVLNPSSGSNSKNSTLRLKTLGEIVTRPVYARTLREIAKNGSSAIFYDPNGPIASNLIKTIRSSGGIATGEDFAKYDVEVSDPLISQFKGRTVYTCRNPSSGPVLQYGLRLLDGYSHTADYPKNGDVDFGTVSTQRMVETMKFMGAARSELGDITADSNNTVRINRLFNSTYIAAIRKNITDSTTHNWDYYSPAYQANDPHGTTHFSIMDAKGGAVGMTTTVNLFFGSLLCDSATGIVLNNQMDDFSVPNMANAFGLQASLFNYVAPYKRPVSSMSPAIIVNPNGTLSQCSASSSEPMYVPHVEMVIGASGGSHITTTVLEEVVRKLDYNTSMVDAIKRARIHHQLLPNVVQVEPNWPQESADDLRSKGHNVTYASPASVSNGLYWNPKHRVIIAVSDWWRKRGQPAGF